MFYRRKIILALLQQLGGKASSTDFQKYLFLFSKLQTEPSFDFVPYRFGCFSFQSYSDRHYLEKVGLIEEQTSKGNPWVSSSEDDFLQQLTPTDQKNVKEFLSCYSSLKGSKLIKFVYKNYPFFAINSVIAERHLEPSELKAVSDARPNDSSPQIFSVGYEGKSIDGYLCRLIENGVQLLCDVRKNPLSRKYGFSKRELKKCVESLGIEYRHLPQLGIESQDRKCLCSFDDYQKLFKRYEQTTLMTEKDSLNEIISFLKKYKRIALTCFEADHKWCHRNSVAEELERHVGYQRPVAHI